LSDDGHGPAPSWAKSLLGGCVWACCCGSGHGSCYFLVSGVSLGVPRGSRILYIAAYVVYRVVDSCWGLFGRHCRDATNTCSQ
jgi:hypothetical protein